MDYDDYIKMHKCTDHAEILCMHEDDATEEEIFNAAGHKLIGNATRVAMNKAGISTACGTDKAMKWCRDNRAKVVAALVATAKEAPK